MTEAKKNTYSVPAVDAMLDIAEFMSTNQAANCGVTELSRELGLSTNLVFRIMRRLEERGYAERDGESGAYSLSSGFFTLGMRLYNRFELRRVAVEHLKKLSEELGETTQMHVLRGNKMMVLEVVTPPSDFFLQVIPGSRLNIHCNAYGKAVLAFMPEADAMALLPKKLDKLTPASITTKQAFKDELKNVRMTGLAYDREEYNTGIFCVGAPVFDSEGNAVAGLGVTGMSSRFCEKRLPGAEKRVLECAANVSAEIGYSGDFYNKLGN